jgi:hypothetical protein
MNYKGNQQLCGWLACMQCGCLLFTYPCPFSLDLSLWYDHVHKYNKYIDVSISPRSLSSHIISNTAKPSCASWVQQGFLLTPALIGSIPSNWADTHSRSIVLRVYVSCVHIWIVHIFAVKKNGETTTPIDGPVSRYSITSILVRRTDRDTDGRTSFFSKTPRVRQLSSEKKKGAAAATFV